MTKLRLGCGGATTGTEGEVADGSGLLGVFLPQIVDCLCQGDPAAIADSRITYNWGSCPYLFECGSTETNI